jgi:feruloyl esterase
MRPGRLGRLAASLLLTAAALLALGGTASAASLVEVPDFGSNPGGLTMYVYRPQGLPPSAPAVVLMHGCRGKAAGLDISTGWRKYADLHRFLLILPQTPVAPGTQAPRCFSWSDARGQGDAASIASMVAHVKATDGIDPHRVFATGFSSGGGMTNAMLATYPELFAAGAPVAGLPYQCSSLETCTADVILRANPGYAGPRPRVQIWHGTADKVVPIIAADGIRNQWVGVLGTGTAPASTEQLRGQTTKYSFVNSAGHVLVTDYRLDGMEHRIPIEPGADADHCGASGATAVRICYAFHAVAFFGLDGGGV